MPFEQIFSNVFLMLLCYIYVLIIVFASGKMDNMLMARGKVRKFLHLMIGNLPFIIPFFTITIFPALVAVPLILVTLFASPYSPFKNFAKRMRGLADLTDLELPF